MNNRQPRPPRNTLLPGRLNSGNSAHGHPGATKPTDILENPFLKLPKFYGLIQEATLRVLAEGNVALPGNAFDALITLAIIYQQICWQCIGHILPLASDAFAAEMINLMRAGTITQIAQWPFTTEQMISGFDAEAARGGAAFHAAVHGREVLSFCRGSGSIASTP